MLNNDAFYYNMFKKYVVAFGHIFKDVHVIKRDSSGTEVKDVHVQLTYAGKRKFATDILRNPEIQKKIKVILPRISYLITNMTPDTARKGINTNTISISGDTFEEEYIFSPVPYDFNIDLVVWAKDMDDLLQIVEQVAVFFNPHFVVDVIEASELDLERRIPIKLNELNFDMETDLDEETERVLMCEMNFTLKGFLYPPIKNKAVIEYMNIKFTSEQETALANIEHVWNGLQIDTTLTEEGVEWPD